MRHRSTAASRTADAAGAEAAQAHRGEQKPTPSKELGDRVVLGLVGLVAVCPVLVWGILKWVLPHHQHAKLLEKPKMHLGLDPAEVLAQLQNHTLLHIGGLHRSGTTLLWKGLALHKSISKLEFQPGADTRHAHWINKVFNEGIFLQTVYPKFGLDHNKFLIRKWTGQFLRKIPFLPEGALPWMRLREGVGRFALNPKNRLSEGSPLVGEQNQVRLFNQWALFWDLSRPVLMEKSPSNLVISPFLHRLWGLGLTASPARFIFLQRHPVAVAMATQRAGGAMVSDLGINDLVENWVAGEERRAEDLRQYFALDEDPNAPPVHRTLTLEALCQAPQRVLGELLDWLGAPADEQTLAGFQAMVQPDPNAKYFRRYCLKLLDKSHKVLDEHSDLVRRFADRVLAVSSYDLRQFVDLCKEVLLSGGAVAPPIDAKASVAEGDLEGASAVADIP